MAEARELLEIKQRLALVETRLQQLFVHLDIAPRESAAGGGGWGAPARRVIRWTRSPTTRFRTSWWRAMRSK